MSYEIPDTSSEKPKTRNPKLGAKIIGITGGIGSGKSTVSKFIVRVGIYRL